MLDFVCDKENCYYSIKINPNEDSGKAKLHRCPHVGASVYGGSVSQSLVEKMWVMLDGFTADLLNNNSLLSSDERLRLKGAARATADCIAIFMVPHFRTGNAVAKEAIRRYEIRKTGEEPETPGLGALRYLPPPGQEINRPRTEARDVITQKLGDKAEQLTQAITAGVFSDNDLCSAFSITQAELASFRKSK